MQLPNTKTILSSCCCNFVRKFVLASIALIIAIGLPATVNEGAVQTDKSNTTQTNTRLPTKKQTVLGLYVTSKEAYEKWKAAPDKIKIIDVRTQEEFIFIGVPTMAWLIPFAVQTYEWNDEKKQFPMKPLPDFVERVKQIAKPEEVLMVMCRSGERGAMAVNMLAKAGFKNVYNVTDGMEGDVVDDPESVFVGQRLKNGWKNSGCPWTYKLTPDRMVPPKMLARSGSDLLTE